jgi:hypothetical protein
MDLSELEVNNVTNSSPLRAGPVVYNDGPEQPTSSGQEHQAEEKLNASEETNGAVAAEEEATEEEAEEPEDVCGF